MEEAYAGSCVQSLFEPKVDFSICMNKSIKLFLKDLNSLNCSKNAIDNDIGNTLNNNDKVKLNNNDNKNGKDDENKEITTNEDKKQLNIDNNDALNPINEKKINNDNSNDNNNDNTHDNSCNNKFLTEEEKKKITEENLSLLNGYSYFNRIGHNINLLHTELASIKKDFLFLSKQTKIKVKKLKNIKKKNMIYKGLLEEVKEDRKRKEMYEKLSIEIQKLDDVRKVQKKQKAEKYSIENYEKKIKNIENTISSNNANVLKTIEQINEIISTNLQIDIK